MVLKKLKAISNSSRNTVLIDYRRTLIPSDKKTPKKILQKLKVKSGRDVHSGSITIRLRKGGHKIFYRIIDFERKINDNIEGKIKSIEYDPNRNAFISLVSYLNGDFRYILNPEGLTVWDKINSGDNENIPLTVGNCLPLGRILTNMPTQYRIKTWKRRSACPKCRRLMLKLLVMIKMMTNGF